MRIRPALYRDLPAIRALLAAEGLPADDIGGHLATLLVGVRQGRVVVTGALEPLGDTCLLRSIVVAPDCRGRGWGRRMTLHLLGLAGRLRMPEVYLLTTTEADFFRALGFAPLPRAQAPAPVRATRQFAALCPATATLMHRNHGILRQDSADATHTTRERRP